MPAAAAGVAQGKRSAGKAARKSGEAKKGTRKGKNG